MKKISRVQLIVMLTILFFSKSSIGQIANNYPGDDSIQFDPNVLFVEMFEEPTITEMLTGWTNKSSVLTNINFGATVPPGSPGSKSCKLTTIIGSTQNEDTYIFKRFLTGISDSIFVRYYIKYNNSSTFHHSGVWIGGNYPSTSYPGNHAGYKPAGDSAFHVGTEVRGATRFPQNSSYFGYYNYWMGMHQSNDTNPLTGTGYYWGNGFINSNPVSTINMSQWTCIEVMVKMNNPVTSKTGELKMWINGVQVSHYGYQFPNGTWNWQDFTNGTGLPFEGFQWRNNQVLKLNYIWLKNYSDVGSAGHINDLYFDHVVVAKSYIGPIYSKPTIINQNSNSASSSGVSFSKLVNSNLKITLGNERLNSVKVYDVVGKLIGEYFSDVIELSSFPKGIYFVKVQTDKGSITGKIVKIY